MYRYQVTGTGPGSLTGPKFTSLSEAMAYVRHLFKQGQTAVLIEKIA